MNQTYQLRKKKSKHLPPDLIHISDDVKEQHSELINQISQWRRLKIQLKKI